MNQAMTMAQKKEQYCTLSFFHVFWRLAQTLLLVFRFSLVCPRARGKSLAQSHFTLHVLPFSFFVPNRYVLEDLAVIEEMENLIDEDTSRIKQEISFQQDIERGALKEMHSIRALIAAKGEGYEGLRSEQQFKPNMQKRSADEQWLRQQPVAEQSFQEQYKAGSFGRMYQGQGFSEDRYFQPNPNMQDAQQYIQRGSYLPYPSEMASIQQPQSSRFQPQSRDPQVQLRYAQEMSTKDWREGVRETNGMDRRVIPRGSSGAYYDDAPYTYRTKEQ